ncbi:hypothetical protein DWY99_09015 [[Clostridium] leptum]|uniref:Uncharacterized protein n=1 Tax=[Clostridium] leptum TaxID=1535 RepID=A0A412AWK2_9FIRM|nr:hypothetical protein DWY99_09015 [[Clostridium] leptum]
MNTKRRFLKALFAYGTGRLFRTGQRRLPCKAVISKGTVGGYGNKKASLALPLDFSTKGRKAPPLRKRKELFPNLSGYIFRKKEGEYP